MTFLAGLSGMYVNLLLGGVLALLTMSIGVVIFFAIYQRRIFAQQQQREAEEKAYQKELLIAAVEVQESERRRIAGDLHDEIGSLLTATRLYLRQLDPTADTKRVIDIKEQSLAIIDEMIQSTRRISHDLLPPSLEKFGFQAAAEDLCEMVDRSDGIMATFTTPTEERMSPKVELALYRVLQELISNTLKHAAATTLDVVFDRQPDNFHFVYREDGRGYDPATISSGGLGLRNIESRIALVGGTLDSASHPGGGLTVTITLPT